LAEKNTARWLIDQEINLDNQALWLGLALIQ